MNEKGRERASAVAVLAAMALVVLDSGLLTIALPTIGDSFAVAPSDAILAISGYQTALVIGLLPSVHAAERFGHRRLFVGGLILFSAASILCAISTTLPLLVAARILQGLGGAAIMSLGIALLRLALGAERLGAAIAWNALTVALCSAAAPVLGAMILSLASWPFLFLAKLPIAALALWSARALPASEPVRRPLDLPGILLHAATAALILAAAHSVPERPAIAALLAAAAVALAIVLVRLERTRQAPVWPLDLIALRPFRIAAAASIFCFAGQSLGLVALAFHLQPAIGHGPVEASLVIACWPLTVAATAPIANRLARRFGSSLPCAAGGAILGAGLLLCALWPARNPAVPLAIGSSLAGLGFGLFQVPNNRTLFMTAPLGRSAAAGGLQGSARLIGQTLGALVMGLLFAILAEATATRAGLALGSVFALAASVVSMLGLAARPRLRRSNPSSPKPAPASIARTSA